MKKMVSKYSGSCRECRKDIHAGQPIAYHGRGRGISCADCATYNEAAAEEAFGLEPGTLASDRRLYDSGITVVRFSSGESFTQNRRGRCEDAPCCGCCS